MHKCDLRGGDGTHIGGSRGERNGEMRAGLGGNLKGRGSQELIGYGREDDGLRSGGCAAGKG